MVFPRMKIRAKTMNVRVEEKVRRAITTSLWFVTKCEVRSGDISGHLPRWELLRQVDRSP